MKTATIRLDLRPAILCLVLALSLVAPRARAQLVNDGETNVLDNVTNSMGGIVSVGTNGSQTVLILTNGGTVMDSTCIVGRNVGADSNSVYVLGSNSLWASSFLTAIGGGGSYNQVVVSNGGKVTTTGQVQIGVNGGFNTALVTGARSSWINGSQFTVGSNSSFNRLVISEGAMVSNGLNDVVGVTTNANSNSVLVTGAGSTWMSQGTLVIGKSNWGNEVIVSNGGVMLGSIIELGNSIGAASNVALITGIGSQLKSTILNVGRSGIMNELDIRDGAVVAAGSVSISIGSLFQAGQGNSNTLSVAGVGSTLIATNSILVGQSGSYAQLLISDAGAVTVGAISLSDQSTAYSSNNLVSVSGAGSSLTSAGNIVIGNWGALNQMIITNGAVVSAASGTIGYHYGSNPKVSNSVVVTGSGSVWTNSSDLIIGNLADQNLLIISNGGSVFDNTGTIGQSGHGNLVIVTDPGSVWNNASNLWVGFSTANRMVVSNGGTVTSAQGYIGGSIAVVTGSGSAWSNSLGLSLGNSSLPTPAQLVVSDGGTVVSRSVLVGNPVAGTNNSITVSGGTLVVTDNGAGSINVSRGSVNLSVGGTIITDTLVLTNGGKGQINLNGGTLQTANTITDNATNSTGPVFVVGDGSSSATFQMLGEGTHGFVNGLQISANATLTGNGTIIGSVTNFGTVTPGSSPGKINVGGSLYLTNGSLVNFELGGTNAGVDYDQIAVTNFVQFAGNMSLALLPGYLPNPSDTFTLVSFGVSLGTFNGVFNGLRTSFVTNLLSFQVSYDNNLVLSSVRYADNDGDGQGDLQELAAGTDPASQASEMRITALARTGGGPVTVTFQSVVGKNYRIEYSTDLITWSVATTAVPANGVGNSTDWIDDGSLTGGLNATTTRRFYRLGLQ